MVRPVKYFYEFDAFRIDPAARLLLREGTPVPLTPKVFETLLALVQNSGHALAKDRLMREVWPDSHVEEANLTQNVFTLRKVLGKSRDGRQYIETVPRLGYRFAATVREVRSEGPHRSIDSLAVLPLLNSSGDPNLQYLSDGLTESIINSLSQLPQLRVMARSTVFRYKSQEVNAAKIGRDLSVRGVLTGRVLQLGERLIISTELVDTADGSQLWGEQYNCKPSDLLALQEEISSEISEKLRIRLTGEEKERLTKRHTKDTEAYQLYLKGCYFLNKYTKEDGEKGLDYFRRAIAIDPDYSLAYVGLADYYYRVSTTYLPPREALPKARAAAMKALELDDTLAEAHTSLAYTMMLYDWDWAGAEAEFKRAIVLKPGYAAAHRWYGIYLLFVGRFDESLAEIERAHELDPLSLQVNVSLAAPFYFSRQYEQAIEQFLRTLEMDQSFWPAHYLLGWVYEERGEFSKAIEEFQRAKKLDDTPMILAGLGYAYAGAGNLSAAQKVLDELKGLAKKRYVSPYFIAIVHAGRGEKDEALEWLEKASDDRSEMLAWLKVAPELDRLRPDPRFASLMRRVGFAT
ncbi:MAG: tetratricopeptide repeat protein [Pyrinomonadaceae bacterium]